MNTGNEMEILPPEDPKPLKKITTIDDLWAIFVKLRGDLAPATLGQYRTIGRVFCDFMRERDLSAKSLADWIIYLRDKCETKRSGRTINAMNTRIRPFLKWLKIMGYVREDLEDALPSVASSAPAEAQMFTEEEYERIKAYCTGRNWCQLHLWLIILAYRTGMSLVDCCHLRWRDIHLNENGPSYIDIHRIKTRRMGQKALCQIPIIPMTDLHEWLLNLKKVEHLNYTRHDGVKDFVHQDAPGYYACTFQRLPQDFKNIFNRAGVFGKTFRNFRNSFCSNLVNSGTQIALVCKMTGHNNVTTLLRYLKADRRALQDGLAKSYQYSAIKSK